VAKYDDATAERHVQHLLVHHHDGLHNGFVSSLLVVTYAARKR
jgi:hypothetical protein